MGEHPTIVLKWINRKSSKRNKTALARFSDNQIELSMEILMSISRRPRALYLVDLVRLLTKGGFCSRGAPGTELGSIGQKFMMDCVLRVVAVRVIIYIWHRNGLLQFDAKYGKVWKKCVILSEHTTY